MKPCTSILSRIADSRSTRGVCAGSSGTKGQIRSVGSRERADALKFRKPKIVCRSELAGLRQIDRNVGQSLVCKPRDKEAQFVTLPRYGLY